MCQDADQDEDDNVKACKRKIIMGSSNPGRVKLSHGGVARNICEALAKGGVSVALVSYLDILFLLS